MATKPLTANQHKMSFCFPHALYVVLKASAKADLRPLNSQIQVLLWEALRARDTRALPAEQRAAGGRLSPRR